MKLKSGLLITAMFTLLLTHQVSASANNTNTNIDTLNTSSTTSDSNIESNATTNSDNTDISGRYTSVQGKVSNVSSSDTHHRITVSRENEDDIIYNIHDNLYVYDINTRELVDAPQFENDQEISAFYGVNTPAALSHPAQINPEVLITGHSDTTGNVKVDYFDENGLSSDRQLQLNLDASTDIIGLGENETYQDAYGKNLLVFYSVETKSMPPQAVPERIVVLGTQTMADDDEESKVIPEDDEKYHELLATFDGNYRMELNGKNFIAIAVAAEKLDYDIFWDAELGAVQLESGYKRITITIGELEYKHSRALGYFETAPFIYNDRTYVEESFLKLMV